MTEIIILVAGLAIALIAGLIVGSKSWLKKGLSTAIVISLLVTISGVILIIIRTPQVIAEIHEKSWPVARGVIVDSEIEGQRAFHPEITFKYDVAGKTYENSTNLNTPAFGNDKKRFNVAETEVHTYAIGDSVDIHYDPANPADSRLRTGPDYSVLLQLSFGVFLYIAGIAAVTASVVKISAK